MDPQAQPQVQQPSLNDEQTQAPNTSEVTKQQIVRSIESGKNVLVTVGSNPSVDQLASAIGLTFMLSKLDKHTTAVFSGKIPSAMEFLDPEQVFEHSVDSLRDFIIALDKEKADKLRYKVEDEVVKIFITPYKTVLSQKDLQFSQGDFNVDVVIALGVTKREDLDSAITNHGRILHDATVITINAGNQQSNLGAIDWNNQTASSVAEMLVNLASTFGGTLLDGQISTAYLTGIVAETNRFSNEKTSPQVMSIAAQLMAAGANQQLIATNLRQEGMISEPVRSKNDKQPHDDNGEMVLDHKGGGDSDSSEAKGNTESLSGANDTKTDALAKDETGSANKPTAKYPTAKSKKSTSKKKDYEDQSLKSDKPSNNKAKGDDKTAHAAEDLQAAVNTAAQPLDTVTTNATSSAEADTTLTQPGEVEASVQRQHKVIEPLPSLSDSMPAADASKGANFGDTQSINSASTAASSSNTAASTLPPPPAITYDPQKTETAKPTFGGTLNATTAGAEEDRAQQAQRESEVNNTALSHDHTTTDTEDPAASLEDARQAVQNAATSQPFNPANQPIQAINTQPLPTVNPSTTPDASAQQAQASPTPPTPPSEPSPVESFMQPHTQPTASDNQANQFPQNANASALSEQNLPPLPPLPETNHQTAQQSSAFPPLPPLPGQPNNQANQADQTQPQINPGFMQNMPQSQNPWTSAGQDMAAKQADKDAARQEKMDKMGQQYDTAVDRNRELQGLPPLNNPNGSGFPPIPPQK